MKNIKIVTLASFALFLNGCATLLTPSMPNKEKYNSLPALTILKNAPTIVVVKAYDDRFEGNAIGRLGYGSYGGSGDIYISSDICQGITSYTLIELNQRGYNIIPVYDLDEESKELKNLLMRNYNAGGLLIIRLNKTRMHPSGFLVTGQSCDINLTLKLLSHNLELLYQKEIENSLPISSFIWCKTIIECVKKSIDMTVQDTVKKIFEDERFLAALNKIKK